MNLIFLLCLFFACHMNDAAQRLIGNAKAKTSFTFAIGPHVSFPGAGRFFVGAQEKLPGNSFSVSFVDRDNDFFVPLAPKHVMFNGKGNQKNPLTGGAIQELSLMGMLPLMVSKSQPSLVYLILNPPPYPINITEKGRFDVASALDLISSPPVNDAKGKVTSGIIGLDANGADSLIFAAVKPHGSTSFGPRGSGIAVGVLQDALPFEEEKKDNLPKDDPRFEKKHITWYDAGSGILGENKAVSLDISSKAVAVAHPVQEILNEKVTIQVFADLGNRLYLPLQVIGNSNPKAGACGLVLGFINRAPANDTNKDATKKANNLILKKALLESAIGVDSIIAARGPDKEISLFDVRLMRTSTTLPYIIVVGGVAQRDDAIKKVFALPIVNELSQPSNVGLVANKNQVPHEGVDKFIIQRLFVQPARTPDEVPHLSDPAARVGAHDAPAPIHDIFVHGDAVFISTSELESGQKPGIFYSQALFDDLGRISGWTRWQRVAGADTPVTGFAFDSSTTDFLYMTNAQSTNATSHDIKTVLRTEWNRKEEHQSNLSKLSQNLFYDFGGGIQEVDVFEPSTESFSQECGKKLSLLVMTGLSRVVVVESGNDKDGFFGPQKEFIRHFSSHNGSLHGFEPGITYLDIQNGLLESIGPVVTATIATDGKNGWLVVGGTGGIAVLANPDGTGWPVHDENGLQSGFIGLSPDMRFVKLGTIKNVHRLIAKNNKMFALSLDQFTRFTLTPESINLRAKAPHKTLLKAGFIGNNFLFLDSFITEGLALIATNGGLLHSGGGVDIQEVENEVEAQWAPVPLPYSTGGVIRFQPITSGVQHALHNLYVLDSSPANDQGRVYRFVVNPRAKEPVVIFPDIFTAGQEPTFFLNIGAYRGYLYTNGAALFLTGSAFTEGTPKIYAITHNLRTGNNFIKEEPLIRFENAKAIGSIQRDPGSGSLFVWTDSGLTING